MGNRYRPIAASLWLLVLLFCLSACGSNRLDAGGFKKELESSVSVAAEAQMLAEQVNEGHVTGPYRRVQAEALSKQAGSIADDLNSAQAEPAIADRVQRVVVIMQGVEEETASLKEAKTPLTAESRLQLYHDVLQLLVEGR